MPPNTGRFCGCTRTDFFQALAQLYLLSSTNGNHSLDHSNSIVPGSPSPSYPEKKNHLDNHGIELGSSLTTSRLCLSLGLFSLVLSALGIFSWHLLNGSPEKVEAYFLAGRFEDRTDWSDPSPARSSPLETFQRQDRIVGGHVTELDETCSLVQQLTDKLGQDNAAVMLAQAGPQQPNVVTSGGVNETEALFADDEDDLFNAIDIPAVM